MAWRKSGKQIKEALWGEFQNQLPTLAGLSWRWKEYVPLAVDGTRFEAPRTPDNEEKLGCAGKENTCPQTQVTMIEHVFTQLPFAAKIGPGTDSEQTHLSQRLQQLPPRTLLIADAGFFSYSLAKELLSLGHSFLLRVGANKTLIKDLFEEETVEFGSDQEVWVWPKNVQPSGDGPLKLRLIEVESEREDTPNVFLLTNLGEEEMRDEESKFLYEKRWPIEVSYRSMKQTFERATLRSRTGKMVLAEVEWLLLSTFLLGALALSSQPVSQRGKEDWSASQTLDHVRKRIRYSDRSGGRWNKRIEKDLRGCVIDRGPRHGPKVTRPYPKKKQQKPPNPPKVRPATAPERLRAKRLRDAQRSPPCAA